MSPTIVSAGKFILRYFPTSVREYARTRYRARLAEQAAKASHERRAREALASIGATDVTTPDVNHLLHHLRGEALEGLPKKAQHFVSVGCAGTWYFEWIAAKCTPVRHTGIEFYSPKPDDLPESVEWIANTAGDMRALADASADVLFSGQNIEHLWPHDIAAFLLESHRVLGIGGLLVVDSPNRRLTSRLGWSHTEHTIELEPGEAEELLTLAGFDVQRRKGLWLCEVPGSGELLPFDEISTDGRWPIARRVSAARDNLDQSFIWWLEARRADRPADHGGLRRRVAQINAKAWPERLNRLQTVVGLPVQRDGQTWFDSQDRGGAVLFGPYTAMPAGRHVVTFELEYPNGCDAHCAPPVAHVSAGASHEVIARNDVPRAAAGERVRLPLTFELKDTTFHVEFVVVTPGTRVLVRRGVELTSLDLAAGELPR
jgi:hypothetical protein